MGRYGSDIYKAKERGWTLWKVEDQPWCERQSNFATQVGLSAGMQESGDAGQQIGMGSALQANITTFITFYNWK